MATWCPDSKQLKAFLNDKQIRDYVSARQLTFVFSENEWPDVETELKLDPKVDPTSIPDMIQSMKAQVHGANVVDPTFFNDLPGPHRIEKLPPEVKEFPTIYSDGNWIKEPDYVTETLGVPGDLALSVLTKYKPN